MRGACLKERFAVNPIQYASSSVLAGMVGVGCVAVVMSVVVAEDDAHLVDAQEAEADGMGGGVVPGDRGRETLARLQHDRCAVEHERRVLPIGVLVHKLAVACTAGDADLKTVAELVHVRRERKDGCLLVHLERLLERRSLCRRESDAEVRKIQGM